MQQICVLKKKLFKNHYAGNTKNTICDRKTVT